MEAGLPNIEGSIDGIEQYVKGYNAGSTTGAITALAHGSKWTKTGTGTTVDRQLAINFDASLSNTIYGSSDTVTPKSLTTLLLIKY